MFAQRQKLFAGRTQIVNRRLKFRRKSYNPQKREIFEPFHSITDFSAGVLKKYKKEEILDKRIKYSNKYYIPIFPDLYDDLQFSEINPESIEFNMTDKIRSELEEDKYCYKKMQISFSFMSGHEEVKEKFGYASEDPFIFKEESRDTILEQIQRSQTTFAPKYIINVQKYDIKCVYFCVDQGLKMKNYTKQSYGQHPDFQCSILIKMETPCEVQKMYGPSNASKEQFDDEYMKNPQFV